MPRHTHLLTAAESPMAGLSPHADFGRRLQDILIRRNMSQMDLVRKAGGGLTRSDVSHYIRGKSLPIPAKLGLIAAALDLSPTDLLTMRQRIETKAPDQPLLRVDAHTEDTAWIRINMAVPWPVAVEVQRILMGAKKNEDQEK